MDKDSLNILISGANGFVGRHLYKLLSEKNNVFTIGRTSLEPNGSNFIKHDFESDNKIVLPNNIDVVIHLAAVTSTGKDVKKLYKTNIEGTHRLVTASIESNIKKFSFLSSAQVHGQTTFPGQPFTEESPYNPQDEYAKSKTEAEKIVREMCDISQVTDYIIIRPPLVYGKGVKGNYKLLENIAAKSPLLPFENLDQNRRSLIHVDKLAKFIDFSVFSNQTNNQSYLVADEIDLSTKDLIKKLKHETKGNGVFIQFPWKFIEKIALKLGKEKSIVSLTKSLKLDNSKQEVLYNFRLYDY